MQHRIEISKLISLVVQQGVLVQKEYYASIQQERVLRGSSLNRIFLAGLPPISLQTLSASVISGKMPVTSLV